MLDQLPSLNQNEPLPTTPRRTSPRVLVGMATGFVILGVAAGVYVWVGRHVAPPVPTPSEPLPVVVQPTQPVPRSLDPDGDGLMNDEEKKMASDPAKPDTDGDGLFDGEEVKAFKTNPLKKDTDGDGVDDGAELRAAMNPNDVKN